MWESSFEPREVNKNSSWLVRDWRQALAERAPARKQRDPSAGPSAASANAEATRAGGSAPGAAAGTPGTRRAPRRTPRPSSAGGAGAEAGRRRLIGGWQLRKVCKAALPPRELGAPHRDLRGSSRSPRSCRGEWTPGVWAGGESCTSLRHGPGHGGVQPSPGGRFKSEEGAGQQGTDEARTEAVPSPASNFPARCGTRRVPGRPGPAEKVPARDWGPGPGSHPGPEPGSRTHTKDA